MPGVQVWLRSVVVLMLIGVAPSAAAQARVPSADFFDQSLGDFREELSIAKDQGKRGVLLFFEQDECPFCHYMKITVFNQPEVQAYFKEHFLVFPVDIEGDVEITDFDGRSMAQKDFAFKVNRVRATPVFIFYDLSGRSVARFTGKTSGPDEFLLLGRFVAEGAYKEVGNFTVYKRRHQAAAERR